MPTIRRATTADSDLLLSMISAYCAADGHDFEPHRASTGLGPLLIDDVHGQAWIVIDPESNESVGYAILTWGWSLEAGGRECLLDEFYVERRGRGLGGLALPELTAAARAAGATVMNLETEAPNERARKFYRRAGFVVEDSIWLRQEL